ncbi:hypothetical protein KVT40_007846 [Elsinoe batatas]|uniref:O-methyltransferase C-terminal domain-containing protein n=1 Tax=Elsinoe batatas TaxID=2601811 RepID=A0A8K0PGP2_9PEZI|nr:hypothetical protein KVT40_007846 [Elsinoe batatas]
METAVEQIKTLVATGGEAARKVALEATRKLIAELETPYDTFHRLHSLHLDLAIAKVGSDLELYKMLSASKEPLSLAVLAEQTKAPEATLVRILRHLSALHIISEFGPGKYTPSNITHHLALPGIEGGLIHAFDNCGPIFQRLPSFLAETSYAPPPSSTNTAFNAAYSTPLPVFHWITQSPERFASFQAAMTVQSINQPSWHAVFPFTTSLGSFATSHPESPVFVDVGGGIGHQCAALIDAFPDLNLKGRVVLQDLPPTIAIAEAQGMLGDATGVKGEAHDFFTPQPAASRGARFYYLRTVLHDWPDEKCGEILKQIADAMGEESEVLIDEVVLPEAGAHLYATTYDLVMMSALAGRERTRGQWEGLVKEAGLEVREVVGYETLKGASIIRCGKKG